MQEAEIKLEKKANKFGLRNILNIASKLLFIPLNPKKSALFIAFMYVAQPITGTFFKTGQEYLEEQGIKPDIVSEITGGVTPHIRDADFIGKAHRILDIPIIPIMYLAYKDLNGKGGHLGDASSNYIGLNSCNISLSSRLYATAKRLDSEKESRISGKESILKTVFHEFAHCNEKNMLSGRFFNREVKMLVEAEAEYAAIIAVEQVFPDSNIADYILALSGSFSPKGLYDFSLFLDAKLNGRDVPTMAEIIKANDRARNDKKIEELYGKEIFDRGKEFSYFERTIENRGDLLALRRVHLAINSMVYIYSKKEYAEYIEHMPQIEERQKARSKAQKPAS